MGEAMSRGTFPIITCDDENGCPEWTLDWFTANVRNWREFMEPGWIYDPYASTDETFCPEHAQTPPHVTSHDPS
jgi:hypothetical protein